MKKAIQFFVCLAFLCTIYSSTNTYAQDCAAGLVEVVIQITPDGFSANENTWELVNSMGSTLAQGTVEGDTLCIPNTDCLRFNIYDTFGDGLINDGQYAVYYDGNLVGMGSEFGNQAYEEFGACPTGYSCHFAEVITEGNHSASLSDTWYSFTAMATGQYQLTACGLGNSCNPIIWVYDYCDNLIWDDTQGATFAHAEDNCGGNEAEISTILENGVTYYIRIGDDEESCAGLSVNWALNYLGPVSGCTDPNSCNYNPLATVSDPSACLSPGDPSCPSAPDLVLDKAILENTLELVQRTNNDDCLITEGCMKGYGERDVIRFATLIKNIGDKDFYVGTPSVDNPLYEFDECHGHWHYENYAEYALYDFNGQEIPIGFKNGFCVVDSQCEPGHTAQYSCGNQGITAGCADLYSVFTTCQWVDVTDVPAGQYYLVLRVNTAKNPDALGNHESSYDNNATQICVEIQRGGDGDDNKVSAVNQITDCPIFEDCAGVFLGTAQEDCEGVCEGTRLAGDVDVDGNYDQDDINTYLAGILNETITPTTCNDVNADGTIDLMDVALINRCLLQESGTVFDHDHCDLPTTTINNPNESVTFSIGAHDPHLKYIDIDVHNPDTKVLGYTLQLSGINILSAVSIVGEPNYNPMVTLNANNDAIMVYALDELSLERSLLPQAALRVYYDGLTALEICINTISQVIDEDLETVGHDKEGCVTSTVGIQLKAYLEGAYLGNQQMSTALQQDVLLLPETQPYTVAPWNSPLAENIKRGMTHIAPNVVDWLLVELRDVNSFDLVAQRTALVLANGELIDIDGTPNVKFPIQLAGNDYHILLRHRNHLDVLSNTSIALANGSSYDFTTAATQAMGNEQLVELEAGVYGLAAGDINGDGIINVTDFNVYAAEAAIGGEYRASDVTLNRLVGTEDFNRYVNNASRIGVSWVRY